MTTDATLPPGGKVWNGDPPWEARDRHDGGTWICKRDETIRRPRDRMIRRKDESDFAGLLPTLDREQREWLADALRRVHPGHAWTEHVES